MQKISKIAQQCLREKSKREGVVFDNIAYGDLCELEEVFSRAGMKVKIPHPLNRHQAVLNALDRESKRPDALFVKEYFRSFEGLARVFTLKKLESI